MPSVEKGAHPFRFKQFEIGQDRSAMKVGTDGILLGAWVRVDHADTILDVGTGTGVIAIMLAQRQPRARITGVEIAPDSARQARENMAASPWAGNLSVEQTPVQEFGKGTSLQFDLIVSNPPFFSGGTFSDRVERNQVRHTIKLPHGDLLRSVQRLLAPKGRFALILPYIEGLRFIELAEGYQLFNSRKCEVRSRAGKEVERLLLEFGREPLTLVEESLDIQHPDGNQNFTDGYKALCRDFYLDF